MRVGTTLNAGDLYESGHTTLLSSPPVTLPTGGKTIYVRLYSLTGTVWTATNYTLTGPPTATGFSVSGNINSSVCCSLSVPGVTVTISTNPPQSTTSDANGNFTFTNVPSGTYTVTPSISGPGVSSVFYPASQSVPVFTNVSGGLSFTATLGYTVTGTVDYPGGAKTGQIYVNLLSSNGGSSYTPGTSVSATGAFTIRGVPPGSNYTLQAWMDNLGKGAPNATSPTGNTFLGTISASVSGAYVSLADPTAPPVLTNPPTIQGISAFDNGAVIQFGGIEHNGVEQPASYYVQWSTSQTFSPVTGHYSFPAIGTKGTNIWILNGALPGISGISTGQQPLYFRVYGAAGASHSGWSSIYGPVTIGPPTGGNTVTGTVAFSGAANGTLYVGFVDQSAGTLYATPYANPETGQTYSVQVPTGSNYFMFGIIDQNNNGVVDVGDIANTNDNGHSTVTVIDPSVPASLTQNLVLSSATTGVVTTNHSQNSGTYDSYSVNFDVRGLTRMPVAVALVLGPNVLQPMDIGGCMGCNNRFQFWAELSGARPNVGDAYTLHVSYPYPDTTGEDVIATVSAVLDTFATNLAPTGTGSGVTEPTFTWTDPLNAASYTYQFTLSGQSTGNIWQVPGNNSKSNGLPSSVTSLAWGVDPTDSTNKPSVTSLTSGTPYQWSIQLQDSNGNSAQGAVSYQP
jgi:hypothetical protein